MAQWPCKMGPGRGLPPAAAAWALVVGTSARAAPKRGNASTAGAATFTAAAGDLSTGARRVEGGRHQAAAGCEALAVLTAVP